MVDQALAARPSDGGSISLDVPLRIDNAPANEASLIGAHPSWTALGWRAKTFRIVHALWSVAGLATLGYVWACAIARRRDRRLAASVAFLATEGAGLALGGGDCPMGPLQSEWGDPVPFFELVLPPRAAKAAVPILAVATVAGFAALVLRPPGRSES